MVISVSLLSAYLYCPRKIFLERVLGFYEPPKESLVIGTIKHEIFDLINKKEEEIVTNITKKISLEELEQIYKNTYSKTHKEAIIKNKEKLKQLELDIPTIFKKTWPLILNEAQSRALNLFNFMQTHLIFGKDLWKALTPKIHSEFKIESVKLELRGIIDQLEIYEKGYVPIELKTGKSPREDVWPNHKIQIAAYAMLLEEKFNEPVKEGFVHYIDVNERRHIPINIFLKDEIEQLIKKVKTLLESQEIPDFCENKNKCNACGLKETCYDEKRLKKRQKEFLKTKKSIKIKTKSLYIT